MGTVLHDKLGSPSLMIRLAWTVVLFFTVFSAALLFSYYLLPEGLLKGKNPLHSWETSTNVVLCAVQIFSFNCFSLLVIVFASLFGQKQPRHVNYLSVGYLAFFTLACINGIVLGTWSFSVESVPVPLLARFLRTFDLAHRAGLWEMMGQLLVTCATARIAIVLTSGKETHTKPLRSVSLARAEQWTFGAGLMLVVIGAVVESMAINRILL